MAHLSSASYAYQMRAIELRRNAALREIDIFCMRAAQEQAVKLNTLFWCQPEIPHCYWQIISRWNYH
jgi:hypothetical protein